MSSKWLGAACLLLCMGCVTRGKLVPLKGDSSIASVAANRAGGTSGVTVEVRPNAWSGVPARLTKVTPVLLKIENEHSDRILIRYDEFLLETPDGRQFHALPPFDIEASQSEPFQYGYPTAGFFIAPYQARFFRGLPRFPGPFIYNQLYFQSYFPAMRRFDLPTTDMLVKALPEGVLDPQGRMAGFLYFENIDPDVEEIEFVGRFSSAATKASLGEIRIPFNVD